MGGICRGDRVEKFVRTRGFTTSFKLLRYKTSLKLVPTSWFREVFNRPPLRVCILDAVLVKHNGEQPSPASFQSRVGKGTAR